MQYDCVLTVRSASCSDENMLVFAILQPLLGTTLNPTLKLCSIITN